MRSRYRLGRLFGIPIEIHFSLLLLLGAMALFGGGLSSLVLSVLLFASVVAHELGHALVARFYGVATADITLYPFGGVAHLRSAPETPKQEVLIAAAGPALSLCLAAILYLGSFLAPPVAFSLVLELAFLNGMLGLFNLIPALPMDGGRIFRAALTPKMGALRATQLATKVARFAAVGLALLGLFTSPMLIVIAVVVWFMSGAERVAAEIKAAAMQGSRVMGEPHWAGTHSQAASTGDPRAPASAQIIDV